MNGKVLLTSTMVTPPSEIDLCPAENRSTQLMNEKIQKELFAADLPTSPSPEASQTNVETTPERFTETVTDLRGKTVYVVDAHALIYQVFHALSGANMTSPRGEPVGAVHGFTRDLLDLLERCQPDYLFCAFDLPGPTFRHKLTDTYKANRDEMPVDLRGQISKIRELLGTLEMPILDLDGFEADDILATMAKLTSDLGGTCYLVTNDKDCRQLISPSVKLYNIRKARIYDEKDLEGDWGIRPDQVVDFQALVGDPVDNVPGVPLIGPKIAADLIQRFETLEGVFSNLDEVSGKKRKENLENGQAAAALSRQLVRLDPEVPIEIDWQQGRTDYYNVEAALVQCKELGFRSLPERLAHLSGLSPSSVANPPPEWEADYELISDLDALDDVLRSAKEIKRVVFDTETTSTSPRHADLVGISLCWHEGRAYYIPVKAPVGDPCLNANEVLERVQPLLSSDEYEKIGQNLKYDMVVLRGAGLEVKGQLFDTMVADYLLDSGQRNHSIDDIALRYFQHETIKIKELIGTGKSQKRMDEVAVELVTPYAAEDADIPCRLRKIFEEKLKQQGLYELFTNVEMPLIRVLAEMEFNGICVNQQVLDTLRQELTDRIEDHVDNIYELAGREFNIDSRIQLSKVLFEELQLPVIKKTKTGPSTDVEVLTELANLHDLPKRLIEYRQDTKLRNTYVDALPELIHPVTGRIHTSFMQDVAATGRLSSKDPNLQNIPVRTETGRAIRRAFIPGEPDWLLLAADYSQIELRVLAHFSQDQQLIEAFHNDTDIHAKVAAEVAGVELPAVTSEMRRKAKAINFGIIYGQGAFGLSKSLGIPQEEAAEFIETYFARYPSVQDFMEQTLDDAVAHGKIKTILGRHRPIDGVRPRAKRGASRNGSERIAINTVIQGSAADLIKLAMLKVYDMLEQKPFRARLLLQIHDELLFEVHREDANELRDEVIKAMSEVYELAVPLKVDTKSGPNWGECD